MAGSADEREERERVAREIRGGDVCQADSGAESHEVLFQLYFRGMLEDNFHATKTSIKKDTTT